MLNVGYIGQFLTRLVQNLTLRNDCDLIPSAHETQQLSSLNDHWTWLTTHSFRWEWWVHGRIQTADSSHEKQVPLLLDHRGSITSTGFNWPRKLGAFVPYFKFLPEIECLISIRWEQPSFKISKDFKRSQKNPKDSERIQKIPKESKSERFQTNLKDSKESKRVQKIPKYSKRFQKIQIPRETLLLLASAVRKAIVFWNPQRIKELEALALLERLKSNNCVLSF